MNREAIGFGLNLTSMYLELSLSDFLSDNLDFSVPLVSVASSQDYFSGQPGYEKAASTGDF